VTLKFLSVVQHTNPEWLGHMEDHLEGRGIRFGYHRPFTSGGKLPDIATIGDGLVLLGGGPWGTVSPGHILPTLDAEVRLARACLMLDKFVLGIGIGAQILSLAAEGGATQTPLRFDIEDAHRATDDALAGLLPATFPSLVYMRDEPEPPAYATILARDAAGRSTVFQIGKRAFGFNGHPGVRRAMLEELVMEDENAPVNSAEALQRAGVVGPAVEDALVAIMAGLMRTSGLTDG
jgi:GMP synthase-like glutamine amidotransferase